MSDAPTQGAFSNAPFIVHSFSTSHYHSSTPRFESLNDYFQEGVEALVKPGQCESTASDEDASAGLPYSGVFNDQRHNAWLTMGVLRLLLLDLQPPHHCSAKSHLAPSGSQQEQPCILEMQIWPVLRSATILRSQCFTAEQVIVGMKGRLW